MLARLCLVAGLSVFSVRAEVFTFTGLVFTNGSAPVLRTNITDSVVVSELAGSLVRYGERLAAEKEDQGEETRSRYEERMAAEETRQPRVSVVYPAQDKKVQGERGKKELLFIRNDFCSLSARCIKKKKDIFILFFQ